MSVNLEILQKTNNLLFSQEPKETDNLNFQYFVDDKDSNIDRTNLRRTYEMSLPKLVISNEINNKENNLNISSSKKDKNNQHQTFSIKNYSLNQNNSLLNEQQSDSQIMKDNNYSSNNDKLNSGKMSISELNDEKSSNNKNKKNIYINDINSFGKKYFS